MADFRFRSGQSAARKLIKTLGSRPAPAAPRAARGAWKSVRSPARTSPWLRTERQARRRRGQDHHGGGANPRLVSGDAAPFRTSARLRRPRRRWRGLALDGVVFDATGITDIAGLRAVYDFFHPLVGRSSSGRAVVIRRPADAATTAEVPRRRWRSMGSSAAVQGARQEGVDGAADHGRRWGRRSRRARAPLRAVGALGVPDRAAAAGDVGRQGVGRAAAGPSSRGQGRPRDRCRAWDRRGDRALARG